MAIYVADSRDGKAPAAFCRVRSRVYQCTGGYAVGTVKRSIFIGAAVIIVLAGSVVALAETGKNQVLPQKTALPITANLNTGAISLAAPAAELINASTGQILYANNVMKKHYPASLAKLMTSLIALEMVKRHQLSLHSIIPVSQSAYQVALTPGLSVAYLNPAEHITLSRMLEYMYVVSADDAAVAMADAIAGTQAEFAKLMNDKARQLGMTGTRYTNASGLQNPHMYTNARDVGLLSRYLVNRYPIVLKYASEPGMYIHPGQYGTNYDLLLGKFNGLDGLKTGSTSEAGYCFVGTAKRGNVRLISVILDTKSFPAVFQDTAALLGFGYTQFISRKIQNAGQSLLSIPVHNAANQNLAVAPHSDVVVNVLRGTRQTVTYSVVPNELQAPIVKGQRVGVENVAVNGHVVLQTPVYATVTDPKENLVEKVWRSVMTSAHHGARSLIDWIGQKLHKYLHRL